MPSSSPPSPEPLTAESLTERLRQGLARGGPVLLATDFDGTLAPIVAHPPDAQGDPAALAALRTLAARGVVTAVVTGRALDDVTARLPPDLGAILVAEHGAVIRDRDGTVQAEQMRVEQRAALEHLAGRGEAFVRAFPGAEIERKSTSVALHVRQLAPTLRTQAEQALQGIAEDARREGLHTIAGRAVLEARPPLSDKGHSLAQIRARVAPGSFLIYAGDDATDEPALRLAAHEGMAVFIASPERSAPSGIDGLAITTQRDWCIALCQLAQPYG